MIEAMPANASIDDILESIVFKAHVDRGLEDIKRGKTISHETVKKRVASWFKK